MRSSASLTHGKRCVEELDRFDHLMGWTFRELRGNGDEDEDDLDREIRSAKQQELSCTAFGVAVNVPNEFVAPTRSAPLKSDQKAAKQRLKKKMTTNVQSKVYCKRATGATASSAARSAAPTASPANSSSHKPTKRKSAHSSTSSLPRKGSEPVDFVYDVSVRRKLREEIDSDRAKTLQATVAKEAQLRAANKWVYDKADHRSGRKQAWNCSEHQQQESYRTHAEASPSARTGNTARRAEAKSTVKASSAASSRSSHTYSKSSKPVKSSIAPNVSEWRTQAFPVYPMPEIASVEWKLAEQQRRQQQQWREAKDVHDTIEDFESRVHQLAI